MTHNVKGRLEDLLAKNGSATIKANGDVVITDPERAWETYLDRASDSGFVNKWAIRGYHFLKRKGMPKSMDWFLQIYFGDSMTRSDQETVDTVGWTTVGVMAVGNVIRGTLSAITRKSYASIGLDGLYLNATTYWKKLTSKKRGNS